MSSTTVQPAYPTSPEALQNLQAQRLNSLFDSLTNNDFYQRKFGSQRLKNKPKLTASSLSIDDLPFTTKQELIEDQKNSPPYGTNLSFELEAYSRFHQTSGTSGSPMRWLDTEASWQAVLACWKIVYQKSGITAADRIFFAFSFGPFLGFWAAFEAGTALNCLCIPGGGLSSLARLRAIIDNRVTVLCCTPTYAIRLGEIAADAGIDMSTTNLQRIVVAGEPGGSIPGVYQRIEKLWPGARVYDHHGMTEVGPMSYECPEKRGRLCIISAHYFCEIIEVGGDAHVPVGERGELVVTNLSRIASPLIRYRTGDLVRTIDHHSEYGSPDLILDGGILGRVDDMVTIRGVNVWPGAIEEIVRTIPDIVEYRCLIRNERGMEEINIEIEAREGGEETALALSEALQTRLALRVPVRIVPADSLPRFEMKAKRWIVKR